MPFLGFFQSFVKFLELHGFWRLRIEVDGNLTCPNVFHRDLVRLARCRRDRWPRSGLELAGAPSGGITGQPVESRFTGAMNLPRPPSGRQRENLYLQKRA